MNIVWKVPKVTSLISLWCIEVYSTSFLACYFNEKKKKKGKKKMNKYPTAIPQNDLSKYYLYSSICKQCCIGKQTTEQQSLTWMLLDLSNQYGFIKPLHLLKLQCFWHRSKQILDFRVMTIGFTCLHNQMTADLSAVIECNSFDKCHSHMEACGVCYLAFPLIASRAHRVKNIQRTSLSQKRLITEYYELLLLYYFSLKLKG